MNSINVNGNISILKQLGRRFESAYTKRQEQQNEIYDTI